MTGPIMPKGKGSGGSAVLVENVKSHNANSKNKQQNQNAKSQQQQVNNNNNNRKRTNSGHVKNRPGQDNSNSNNKKQQGGGASGSGSSNSLFNANSRFGKGGRNFSGPPNPPPDLLTPIVPPLYPPTSAPSSLKTSSLDKVAVYKRFCRFYTSNCKIISTKSNKSAFQVERYTDMYKAPLTLNSDIVHKIHPLRIPSELSSTSPFKKPRKLKPTASKIIAEVDLEDDDENPGKRGGGADKDKNKTNDEDVEPPVDVLEEEEMDDADDELDMGTDYVSSYFDNGEGFLDSDHDGDDDGAIY